MQEAAWEKNVRERENAQNENGVNSKMHVCVIDCAMVRLVEAERLLEKWCRKIRTGVRIMRQTQGRQNNLGKHVEGQHVLVMRHRGGGPVAVSKAVSPNLM